jgi:hypothetical protein
MDPEHVMILSLLERTALVIASLIATVYGGILIWLVRRVLALESSVVTRRSEINKKLAVLETQQGALKENLHKIDERNNVDHDKILTRLDKYNEAITRRLDQLVKIARNGASRGS